MTETRPIVVALAIDDLMLASRVREALRGFVVDLVRFHADAATQASARPDCVLVSMASRRGDPVECIRAAKDSGIPVVAFAGHLESDRLEQARSAGADRVVANSSVSSHLPEVLRAIGLAPEARS
ncbi:MAG: hypothetical protein ACKO5K_10860 [Armatimonadota bacterium]